MAQKTFCSWCGTNDAKMQCACLRVNYCNAECMRAARAEHRLACPASKPTTNNLKPGAIVRIAGLQSEVGMQMNNLRAEVLEH